MHVRRYILGLLASALLVGCAADPPPSHTSYGPANNFPGMAPSTGMRNFQGMSGWGATDENYRSATPAPFKGF